MPNTAWNVTETFKQVNIALDKYKNSLLSQTLPFLNNYAGNPSAQDDFLATPEKLSSIFTQKIHKISHALRKNKHAEALHACLKRHVSENPADHTHPLNKAIVLKSQYDLLKKLIRLTEKLKLPLGLEGITPSDINFLKARDTAIEAAIKYILLISIEKEASKKRDGNSGLAYKHAYLLSLASNLLDPRCYAIFMYHRRALSRAERIFWFTALTLLTGIIPGIIVAIVLASLSYKRTQRIDFFAPQGQRVALLAAEYPAAFLHRALHALSSCGPRLNTAKNRQLLKKHAGQAADLANALARLHMLNPQSVEIYRELLDKNPESAHFFMSDTYRKHHTLLDPNPNIVHSLINNKIPIDEINTFFKSLDLNSWELSPSSSSSVTIEDVRLFLPFLLAKGGANSIALDEKTYQDLLRLQSIVFPRNDLSFRNDCGSLLKLLNYILSSRQPHLRNEANITRLLACASSDHLAKVTMLLSAGAAITQADFERCLTINPLRLLHVTLLVRDLTTIHKSSPEFFGQCLAILADPTIAQESLEEQLLKMSWLKRVTKTLNDLALPLSNLDKLNHLNSQQLYAIHTVLNQVVHLQSKGNLLATPQSYFDRACAALFVLTIPKVLAYFNFQVTSADTLTAGSYLFYKFEALLRICQHAVQTINQEKADEATLETHRKRLSEELLEKLKFSPLIIQPGSSRELLEHLLLWLPDASTTEVRALNFMLYHFPSVKEVTLFDKLREAAPIFARDKVLRTLYSFHTKVTEAFPELFHIIFTLMTDASLSTEALIAKLEDTAAFFSIRRILPSDLNNTHNLDRLRNLPAKQLDAIYEMCRWLSGTETRGFPIRNKQSLFFNPCCHLAQVLETPTINHEFKKLLSAFAHNRHENDNFIRISVKMLRLFFETCEGEGAIPLPTEQLPNTAEKLSKLALITDRFFVTRNLPYPFEDRIDHLFTLSSDQIIAISKICGMWQISVNHHARVFAAAPLLAIAEAQRALDRMPRHLCTEENLDAILGAAIGVDIPDTERLRRVTDRIQQIITPEIRFQQRFPREHPPTPPVINASQSTHTASVHRTVSESARKLKARYGWRIHPSTELSKILGAIQSWADEQTSIENQKGRFVKEMIWELVTDERGDYRDPESMVSARELLAFCWLAIHDEDNLEAGVVRENALNAFSNGLYEAKRNYNLDEQGRDAAPQVTSYGACTPGVFNKLIESLSGGIHRDISIVFLNRATATAKLPVLILAVTSDVLQKKLLEVDCLDALTALKSQIKRLTSEGFSSSTKSEDQTLWQSVATKAGEALYQEFGSLWPDGKESRGFRELIEGGQYAGLENLAKQLQKSIESAEQRLQAAASPSTTSNGRSP